jgi:hypothetical protein
METERGQGTPIRLRRIAEHCGQLLQLARLAAPGRSGIVMRSPERPRRDGVIGAGGDSGTTYLSGMSAISASIHGKLTGIWRTWALQHRDGTEITMISRMGRSVIPAVALVKVRRGYDRARPRLSLFERLSRRDRGAERLGRGAGRNQRAGRAAPCGPRMGRARWVTARAHSAQAFLRS